MNKLIKKDRRMESSDNLGHGTIPGKSSYFYLVINKFRLAQASKFGKFCEGKQSVMPVLSRYLLAAVRSSLRSQNTFQRANQRYLLSKRITNVSFYSVASFVCLLALFFVVFVHC